MIHKVLFSDIRTKLMAFFLALFLWVYLDIEAKGRFSTGSLQNSVEMACPVNVMTPPNFPFPLEVEPKEVTIRIEGTNEVIQQIRQNKLPVADRIYVFVVIEQPVSDVNVGKTWDLPLRYQCSGEWSRRNVNILLMPNQVDPDRKTVRVTVKGKIGDR